MKRIVFNDYVDAVLAALFIVVVVASVIYGFINARRVDRQLDGNGDRDRRTGRRPGGRRE